MTENEAIQVFKELLDVPCEMLVKYDSVTAEEQKNALVKIRVAEDMAIQALEEIQQYRAIGTIDEFKALKEKNEKGLLLELPCKIGDWVWTWEYPTRIDEEDGSTWTICDIKRATIVSKKFNIFMLDRVGESYFASKEEAEKALAKKQGK